MSDNADDEFRTPDERDADEFDRLEELYLANPQVRYMYHLGGHLDAQQASLQQLQHEDPVGMVWFGDDDQWVDKRLDTLE